MKLFFRNIGLGIIFVIVHALDNWGKVLCTLLALFFVFALSQIKNPVYDHEYEVGDVVCMQITNEKVQVIDESSGTEKLLIRIVTQSNITDDGVTTSAREYDTMRVKEFELGQCK